MMMPNDSMLLDQSLVLHNKSLMLDYYDTPSMVQVNEEEDGDEETTKVRIATEEGQTRPKDGL